MNLHQDKKLFTEAIQSAAQFLEINPVFVEKDYWICHVLWNLSKCEYNDRVVFKGGTSLSKGHQIIKRFSEDVDLAVINEPKLSNNKIKDLIRNVEKNVTIALTEKVVEGTTSKGSRFRKTVFSYPSVLPNNASNTLLTEINSFANPFPYSKEPIETFISKFFRETSKVDFITKFGLETFEVNVMDAKQTLTEKMVSLIRFSFEKDPVADMKSKIRHFYDLHYLIQEEEISEYIESEEFKQRFNDVWEHDKAIFDEPLGWKEKAITDSPLVSDFSSLWNKIKEHYKTELSGLAFAVVPSEEIIIESFDKIISKLK